jgi:chemotaxis signal transduction protein
MSSEQIATIAGAKDETQLVTFMLKDEEFGFDIMSVQEIIRPPKLSKVPRTPTYVDGIANLRGVVLPIIDMRPRFGMDHAEDTDSTRVLVIDVKGVKIGLRVDRVKQVTNLLKSDIEEPPAAIQGTSTDYLTGVVKLDSGARLIMALDAAKVCDLKMEGARSTATSGSSARDNTSVAAQHAEVDDLQQLVSFRVAKEEFAFPMERVREILRVQAPTKVPDVPDYVLGVLTVRGKLLPIIDLRRQLRLESMADEYIAKCAKVRHGYERRVKELTAESEDSKNEWTTSASEVFHAWVLEFSSSSQVLMDGIATLRALDEKLLRSALQGQQFEHSGDVAGIRECQRNMAALAAELAAALAEFEQKIAANIQDDQRIVVVDAGGMLLGLVVDHVSEVLQVSRKSVDPPPAITSGDGHDLSGIARLDEGKRLLLLLDPTQILKQANLERLSNSGENPAQENSVVQNAEGEANAKASDEVQLVTFILGNEEFGIPIAQIQEIDRLSTVTKIPKTADFVEGVTNLRGEVVSVVNTRKRFGLDLRSADDHTRIIIVDLNGVKTGLIVDSVREVLTLSKSDISAPPDAVQTDREQQFVSGICKVDNGKRIIFLLNVEEVLPSDQRANVAS